MAVLGTSTLTGCSNIPDFIGAGTTMLFQSSTAPTNWTKDTTHNNKILRVVSGNASFGGGSPFTSILTTIDPPSSAQDYALTSTQNATHGHTVTYPGYGTVNVFRNVAGGQVIQGTGTNFPFAPTFLEINPSNTVGQGQPHNHSISTGAMDFAVKYVDIILAYKN